MTQQPALLAPFYMWAGGKTRLLKAYSPHFPNPASYTNYVEPFFGGGAVWCDTVQRHPHLNTFIGDVNREVVGLLQAVRDNPTQFLHGVEALLDDYFLVPADKESRKAWYYRLRSIYWTDPNAATLFVLMRLGFNGIWQTNAASEGLYATPAGLLSQSRREQVYTPEKILLWSKALQNAKALHAGSYLTLDAPYNRDTLIYLDPPYRGSFTTYGTGFSDEDQKQLISWSRDRIADGCKVVFANRKEEGDMFFETLLEDTASFHYFQVSYTAGRRKRVDGKHEAKAAVEFIAVSR